MLLAGQDQTGGDEDWVHSVHVEVEVRDGYVLINIVYDTMSGCCSLNLIMHGSIMSCV